MELKPMHRSTPEREGVPSGAIEKYLRALVGQKLAMHSVMFVRHGKIISESYFKPFGPEFRHRLYSCSKSFTSVAIGVLAERGLLSLDDKCVKFFPDKVGPDTDPYLKETTIRDLLLMAAPYTGGSSYSPKDPCWEDTFFHDDVSHVPGTVFSYCTTATTMLCAIIRRVTGKDFLEILRPAFDEIGIGNDIFCVETPEGIQWGGSGVCATAREFAKFANLCMHYGEHEGRQILPRDYLKEATSRQIDNLLYAPNLDQAQGYGYQIWMLQNGGFAFYGMGGQYALCFPDKDFLVVTTGYEEMSWLGRQEIFHALWREVFPLISDLPLNDDPTALASLETYSEGLILQHAQGEPDSPMRAAVNAKTYRMRDNAMGIKWVRFDFADTDGSMSYENATGEHVLRFGMCRNVYQQFPERYYGRRIGTLSDKGYDCHISAAWTMPNSLMMYCQITDIYLGQLRMLAVFKGNTVTLNGLKHAEWFLDEYLGFASGSFDGT